MAEAPTLQSRIRKARFARPEEKVLNQIEAGQLSVTNTNATRLPTLDPNIAGQLWVSGTTVMVSAG